MPAASDLARTVVVSIHDVSPSRLEATAALLASLDRMGVRPRVLKVIPAEPGTGDGDYRPLWDLVRAEQAAGSEVVLHGWSHRVEGGVPGAGLRALRARLVAPRDAEFMAIGRQEARRRLEDGRSRLERAGIRAGGFCAPGWLAPGWLPSLLADLGYSHDVGMWVLRDLRVGRGHRIPWAGQVGGGPLHERIVSAASRAMLSAGRGRPCVKVFLHPAAGAGLPALDRTLELLAGLLRTRRPGTYADFLA